MLPGRSLERDIFRCHLRQVSIMVGDCDCGCNGVPIIMIHLLCLAGTEAFKCSSPLPLIHPALKSKIKQLLQGDFNWLLINLYLCSVQFTEADVE